ncbi:MAG: outer membrane lipoprotein carrier protein LolA [Woeseiaceae bacterium]
MFCAAATALCLAFAAAAEEPVATDTTLAEVAAQLAAPAVLRGKFEQTREVRILSKPLHSSGHFVLSDLGLFWQQEQPVASILIADSERLLQSVGDGPLQSVDVARNPVVLTFSQSFLSIFRGDEAQLREQFDVAFQPGTAEGRWRITLNPVNYPMSEAIKSIKLDGREYIETLTVTSRSSETTTISFSDLQTEPVELTEHEIQLYAR